MQNDKGIKKPIKWKKGTEEVRPLQVKAEGDMYIGLLKHAG